MRITPRPLKCYPWYLRLFFWTQRRRYGAALEPALLWARVPRLFMAFALFYGGIERRTSPLDPALRTLAMLRVSQLNCCEFCIDLNSANLLGRGASIEKLMALSGWRESPMFDEIERAALDYAEAMTAGDRRVDDVTVKSLGAHFDEQAIIELTALIAFQNMSSKFNAALDAAAQGICRLPADRESPPV